MILVQRRPAQRDGLSLAFQIAHHRVHDRPVASDADGLDQRLGAPLDRNRLLDHLHVFPIALVFNLVRVVQVLVLDEQILLVGVDGGHAPRHVIVVPDEHAGRAGQPQSDHVIPAAVQPDFVEHGGHLQAQVRVVGQQRHTGGRVTAGHHPVVAADVAAVGFQQPAQRGGVTVA